MGYLPDPIKQHFAGQDLGGFSLEYVSRRNAPSGSREA
jgi:hypothetical protein